MDAKQALELEYEHERKMFEDGRKRYLDAAARQPAHIQMMDKGVQELFQSALGKVSAEIRKQMEDSGPINRVGPSNRPILEALTPDGAAFLGLYYSWMCITGQGRIVRVVSEIGKAAEIQIWCSDLIEENPGLWKRVFKKVSEDHSGLEGRVKAIKRYTSYVDVTWQPWKAGKRASVGGEILNAVLVASELFELVPESVGEMRLRPGVVLHLEQLKDHESWMSPRIKPMRERPKDWGDGNLCPFYDGDLFNSHAAIIRSPVKAIRAEVEHKIRTGTPPFAEALNIIQSTPFRINSQLLDVIEWAKGQHLNLKKFPDFREIPDVPKPADYEALDAKAKQAWKRQRSEVHTRRSHLAADHAKFMTDLEVARELSGLDRMYLPVNMDSRGRTYPIPTFNYQDRDWVRSLFEFADGLPLGEQGANWLAIHLANCGDFDKISKQPLQSRIQWVDDHESRILSVASDPRSDLWWTEADKPFQFLAACLDFKGWKDSGESEAYVSHLPIALDGTNSGLQHYAAALRSAEDGALVNLSADDTGSAADVYGEVADKVNARLADIVERGEDERRRELAKLWLDYGVSRSTVKRNVMTFGYSSRRYGFRNQLMEDLMRPLQNELLEGRLEGHPFAFGDDYSPGFQAADLLAELTYDAVVETVSGAAQGMEWLRKVAQVMSSEGLPVKWVTPVGLPVTHQYNELQLTSVKLHLYDVSIRSSKNYYCNVAKDDHKQDGKLLKHKQTSAIAPNAIHSMDAAHLMLTVLMAADEGIEYFQLIHDSFATHAARTHDLFFVVREAFVRMYESFDIFQAIYDSCYVALSDKGREKLPLPPERGNLDIEEILNSEFAFS